MRDDPMRCSGLANAMLERRINRGSPPTPYEKNMTTTSLAVSTPW